MSIKSFAVAMIALSAIAIASQARATTLDFEGIPTPGYGTYLTTEYGLTWTGLLGDLSVVVSSNSSIYFNITGVAHSGVNFAWSNGYSQFTIESPAFTLNNLWMRTASQPATVAVKGFKNGIEIYSVDTAISGDYRNLSLNFVNIDKVTFVGNNSGNLFFDDVDITRISAVPEPEAYAMLLAGVGLVGFAARRKRMHS